MSKLTSAIKEINLKSCIVSGEEYAATFNGEVIEPTFINFGYGSNGTGKSSVAKAIQDDVGIVWSPGKSSADYDILVYNQRFLDEHFANYGYLPGIYTLGDKNIEIRKQIDDNTAEAKKLRDRAAINTEARAGKEGERSNLLPSYYDLFWQTGAKIREDFKKIFTGRIGSKAAFSHSLLQNLAIPVSHDIKELKEQYDVAYGGNFTTPDLFDKIDLSPLNRFIEYPLLDQPIISGDDTGFSRFIKALEATDWIRRGLERYVPHTEGRCLFCQQELPYDFKEQVEACFNEQYRQEIDALIRHRRAYKEYMDVLVGTLIVNRTRSIYPNFNKEHLDSYDNKVAAIESAHRLNLQLLENKLAEPSMTVRLENVEPLCIELNEIIDEYNRQALGSRAILANLKKEKSDCEKKVLELLADTVKPIITKYGDDDKKLNDEIVELSIKIKNDTNAANALDEENGKLSKQTVSIEPAVDGINKLLHSSGFQGFELRVHKDSGQSAYRVIRPHTGKTAKDLSEGERNFIGFLYFYFLLRGSHSDKGRSKEKVVVIDDPVSSLDANAMQIVGKLVREVIDACLSKKNITGIIQVFVLTHNVHFHTEAANHFVARYDVASYYHLKKINNVSTITHCIRDNPKVVDEKINYNPVSSIYAKLWKDYKSENNPKELRSLIIQILDNYFIYLSGNNWNDLHEYILDVNRESFIKRQSNGMDDSSMHIAASRLLANAGSTAPGSDEEFFAEDDGDADNYRETLKMIFAVMEQDQHYKMMTEAG